MVNKAFSLMGIRPFKRIHEKLATTAVTLMMIYDGYILATSIYIFNITWGREKTHFKVSKRKYLYTFKMNESDITTFFWPSIFFGLILL